MTFKRVTENLGESNEETPKEEQQEIVEPSKPMEEPQVSSDISKVKPSDLPLGEMPSYTSQSENSAPTIEEPKPTNEQGEPVQVDIDGTPFDPELHAVDAFGNPKKTKAGTWRKKRGKGKATTATTIENKISDAEYKASADAYFKVFKQVGSRIMGDHFAQHDKETGEGMLSCIEAVCRKHQSTGLSAEQMLFIMASDYTLKKAEDLRSKRRFAMLWLKVSSLWSKDNKEKLKDIEREELEKLQQQEQ